MKIKLLFAIIGMLIGAQTSIAKEWRGIVPLKSTRADVERRFGKPDKWGEYEVYDERVSFEYSDGPCKGLYRALGKDNCYCFLEEGTVLSIYVQPTARRRFSDLKLDLTEFKKVAISPFPNNFAYYNPTEGIDYTVDESEDQITTIDYDAAAVDCENIIKSRAPKYRNIWRGLRPLHSTRKDVEALFGSSKSTWETSGTYETDYEVVGAKYSDGSCDASRPDWNVPKGTLLELVVTPIPSLLLGQLHLDEPRYQRLEIFPRQVTDNLPKAWEYVDNLNGITIRTQSSRGEGLGEELLASITYLPAKKDEKLRCNNAAQSGNTKP